MLNEAMNLLNLNSQLTTNNLKTWTNPNKRLNLTPQLFLSIQLQWTTQKQQTLFLNQMIMPN